MNVTEVFFLLSFLAMIGILFAKLYNVFSAGLWYDARAAILSFIGYFIAYGVAFVCLLTSFETAIYGSLFRLVSWLILLNVVLFVAEVFFLWRDAATGPKLRYNALAAREVERERL